MAQVVEADQPIFISHIIMRGGLIPGFPQSLREVGAQERFRISDNCRHVGIECSSVARRFMVTKEGTNHLDLGRC